ncbi:hypothetical protein, partial [Methylobacterium sp. 174MFSha1.1]|uniref:hypothetical protein n=1 Tax=Methylobacterium sp. 174MFSha1.1 TaxID=1502749 RepID=UPI001AECD744
CASWASNWKTDLAMSRPMMLICVTDGLLGWVSDDLNLALMMPAGAVHPNIPGLAEGENPGSITAEMSE